MMTRTALFCLGPGAPRARSRVRQVPRRNPAADEVEIAVAGRRQSIRSTCVAPKATGCGSCRCLAQASFRWCSATILPARSRAPGRRFPTFKPGDRVYGLKPTSADGTHASHVLVKAAYVLRAPAGGDLQALAAIPYSFVTMWLAVRGAGITRENAAGKKVLVHGAAGGLGTLALQMLSAWGAKITAIARPPTLAGCLQAGAAEVVDGSKAAVRLAWPHVRCDAQFRHLGR